MLKAVLARIYQAHAPCQALCQSSTCMSLCNPHALTEKETVVHRASHLLQAPGHIASQGRSLLSLEGSGCCLAMGGTVRLPQAWRVAAEALGHSRAV